MSTIEELLTTPQVDEEVWELDNRYEVNLAYSDDQGPVEVVGKNIGSMSNQISIQGESMSQYLEFMMPRYYDNIDLSDKTITIHYEMNGAGGEITPINMYRSQDKIKFGWVIPAAASQTFGNLSIGIWARGYVNAEEYIWKSRTASYTIEKGLMIGGGIPEPDENWYLEFVRQMDVRVAEASLYASRAKQSESSASSSESAARGFMEEARTGASTAVQKAGEALNSASTASASSIAAQESATLAMEYRDGAEEYYERTKGISEGLSGQLVPMGTVTFENLPALEDAVSGWMYNISNEFTTTSQFKEGAGKVIPLGSNVYKTTDGYWDVLAGSPVSGVKGSAEATYRSGNVNITPANLGITVVNNTKDENKNVNHSKTSDSTTKAAQDSNGNVIVDTYASKSEASISGTATGTNPTIQDSTNAPIIYLKENGYTEQFTTTGKNLLKSTATTQTISGVTYTFNEDGSVTLNGTATAWSFVNFNYIDQNTNALPDGDYILSGGTSTVKLTIIKDAKTSETNLGGDTNFSISNTSNNWCRIESTANKTYNNVTVYPMIRLASTTDSTYEPYTGGIASPNPDYPQEIEGLDKVSVKTCGKNIFGGLALENKIVGVVSGATKNEETGSVSFSGSNIKDHILFNDFKENTQYTFIFYGKNLGSYKALNVCIYYTDGTKKLMAFPSTDISHYVLVSDVGKTVEKLEGVFQDSTTLLYPNQCGIFEGIVTLDDFEPYKETTATIPTDAPLYERDYLEVYADGSGKVVRKMGSVVFDGSDDEKWEITISNNGTTYVFYKNSLELGIKNECINIYSSHYKNTGRIRLETNNIYTITSGTLIIVEERFATVAEYKTWLQSNPVTVVYELATPQEIKLTAEQVAEFKKLCTFEPVTNVFCDGEVEMIYFRNNPNGRVAGMLQKQIDSAVSILSSTEEV